MSSRRLYGDENFVATETVGGFEKASFTNSFDDIFTESVKTMAESGIDVTRDITPIVTNKAVTDAYKDLLLSAVKTESQNFTESEQADAAVSFGTKSGLYDQVSQLFDNCINDFYTESATSQLLPIKTLDLPILVKEHLKVVAKDIMQTEVTPSPLIKKHLEQTYIYSAQDPTKRWRYPQCFFDSSFKDIYKEGKGVQLDETKMVALPATDINIVTSCTSLTGDEAKRQIVSFATEIVGGYVAASNDPNAELVKFMFNQPMRINLSDGQWLGGKINQTITVGGVQKVIDDQIFGSVNLREQKTTLLSAKGVIKGVIFSGYLTNENNERHVRFDYEREEREFKIADGSKADMPFSMEELEDTKALLNVDLYKKTYNSMTDYLADQEDSDILAYLDEMFDRYKGVELDPLAWNSLVMEDKFDADPSYITTCKPSEYVQTELKFKIDSMILDLADTVKMENLTFVIYGNPRYIRFLDSSINWVARPGSTSNGVKLDYSYGIMTTAGVKVQVVATKKINASYNDEKSLHRGLRIIPFPLNPEQMTFKHYKYTTHIVTNSNSAYRAPELPGGSQTYFMGVSRYTNVAIQGIQSNLYLQNFERYITMGLASSTLNG